jgi:hypothetical protein
MAISLALLQTSGRTALVAVTTLFTEGLTARSSAALYSRDTKVPREGRK